MVEARFVCGSKGAVERNPNTGDEGQQVFLSADIEDPVFKVFTPSGSISMKIQGPAAEQFEPGKKYKVTFEAIE